MLNALVVLTARNCATRRAAGSRILRRSRDAATPSQPPIHQHCLTLVSFQRAARRDAIGDFTAAPRRAASTDMDREGPNPAAAADAAEGAATECRVTVVHSSVTPPVNEHMTLDYSTACANAYASPGGAVAAGAGVHAVNVLAAMTTAMGADVRMGVSGAAGLTTSHLCSSEEARRGTVAVTAALASLGVPVAVELWVAGVVNGVLLLSRLLRCSAGATTQVVRLWWLEERAFALDVPSQTLLAAASWASGLVREVTIAVSHAKLAGSHIIRLGERQSNTAQAVIVRPFLARQQEFANLSLTHALPAISDVEGRGFLYTRLLPAVRGFPRSVSDGRLEARCTCKWG